MKRALASLLAGAAGAASWLATCRITGQAEAWDSMVYLRATLPALACWLAILGFWVRGGALGLGISASLGQLLGLALSGGSGSTWPLGVGFLAALAIPLGLSAVLGGVLRGLLGLPFRLCRSGPRGSRRAPDPGSSGGLPEACR